MSAVAISAVSNWLCEPGRNPYGLLPPPESFLRELAIYDADAVIFPSARQFGYWLTRRRKLTKGITTVLNLDLDSAVMARHGLIPVTLFGGHITWGPQVMQWLADRDIWRHGGAEKAANTIEKHERSADERVQKSLSDENRARARSMYRTYKRRVGEAVVVGDTTRGYTPTKRGAITESQIRNQRSGSAPVPPTGPVVAPGWTATPSGLVTPPTS